MLLLEGPPGAVPPPEGDDVRPARAMSIIALLGAVAGCGALLWSASEVVGSNLGVGILAVLALGMAGVAWLVGVVLAAVDALRDRSTPAVWWLLAAFVVVVVTFALVAVGAPSRARWAHARPDFAAVVERADPDLGADERHDLSGPVRLGTIDVESVEQVGDAVIFHTGSGLFSLHGIAYLPAGRPSDLDRVLGRGERSELDGLGGHWYRWSTVTD